MSQFYDVNKIEHGSSAHNSKNMSDIVDARTLRRLNRLKKREAAEKAVQQYKTPDPVLFVDMPWYQLNLNMLLDGEQKPYYRPEPLYVCKSCFEYNTAYSTDFVPMVCNEDVNTSTAPDVAVRKEDASDSKSDSSWTDVSSLKGEEIAAAREECSDTPDAIVPVPISLTTNPIPIPIFDLSGSVVDVSGSEVGNQIDVSGATLEVRTPSSDVKSCNACCIIC